MISADPAPLRPDDDAALMQADDSVPPDFIVYYAGSDYASTSRMYSKVRFMHPECRTLHTVSNPRLTVNETVDLLVEKIISSSEELNMRRLAQQLKQGERLHGGHGNRGPAGVLVNFIRTSMRLRASGPSWRLYVDVSCPEVYRLLQERGYDPQYLSAAWNRKRKRVYPWWWYLLPQK